MLVANLSIVSNSMDALIIKLNGTFTNYMCASFTPLILLTSLSRRDARRLTFRLQEACCTELNIFSHGSYIIVPFCILTTTRSTTLEIVEVAATRRIPSYGVVHPVVPLIWITSHFAFPIHDLVTPLFDPHCINTLL